MTNVTVKRVAKANDFYFRVEWHDGSKHFAFKENRPEDDIWNEEVNKKRALEFAKKIENGLIKDGEEIIYKTPNQ